MKMNDSFKVKIIWKIQVIESLNGSIQNMYWTKNVTFTRTVTLFNTEEHKERNTLLYKIVTLLIL